MKLDLYDVPCHEVALTAQRSRYPAARSTSCWVMVRELSLLTRIASAGMGSMSATRAAFGMRYQPNVDVYGSGLVIWWMQERVSPTLADEVVQPFRVASTYRMDGGVSVGIVT